MRRSLRVGGTATILVTDLVGSTAMFDRLGDQRAERLLRTHLSELRDLVRAFGGAEVKSTGDGIMAAFPAAWLATECAVAMQRSLHLRNEDESEEPLHIRIGLHSGDTTADRHDYYGIAVAVAARLCDKAPADGILVSDVTRGLVGSRGGHGFGDAGVSPLKGVDEPLRAWTLEWGPGQLPPAPPPGLEPRRGALIGAGASALVLALGGIFFLARGDADEPSPPAPLEAPGTLVRVSVRDDGFETQGRSFSADIAGDGSNVVFVSDGANLVPSDANGATTDVFRVPVTPLDPAALEIVSTGTRGQGNGASTEPSVSDDGAVVGFLSRATNLAPKPDTNKKVDAFVRSLPDDLTSRVSIGTLLQAADDHSLDVDVSGDGDYLAFTTAATNLAVQPDLNGVADIFVRDRILEKTNRVNIRSGTLSEANKRSFDPDLSEDAHFVAFASFADDLAPRDTNNSSDAFRYDRIDRKTRRVSVASDRTYASGSSLQPSISDTGTRVAFASGAPNLVEGDDEDLDVFVHDFDTGETILVSVGLFGGPTGNGDSEHPSLSGNGRYVVFESDADNLVPRDSNERRDVFLFDLKTNEMSRLSITHDGKEATDNSFGASITDDGDYVAFTSVASLVDGDTNRREDVYLRGPLR